MATTGANYEIGSFSASATFTPAASSHTAPACIGAAGTFTLSPVPPTGALIRITDIEMEIDGATIETTAWTLHLYNVTPPSAIADASAFDLVSGDRTAYLGSIAISQIVDLGSTLWIEAHGVNKTVKLLGNTIFGYLVNGTTLTPQAVAHIVKIYGTVGPQ
jgi:hypothetical protein